MAIGVKGLENLETIVTKIQQGNENLREELISSYKNFIHKYTCSICKAQLNWNNDDELSIALIAFNKAIDKFIPDQGKNFLSFAKIIIKNSLIDYFRYENKFHSLPLSGANQEEEDVSSAEAAASWDSYRQEIENRNRAYEIQRFNELLVQFGLTLEKLVRYSPRHQDTRNSLKEIAQTLSTHKEIVKKIYQMKRLPLKEIQLITGARRGFLDKWRNYLLSLIIILTHEEMDSLAEYIRGKEVF